MNRRTTKLVSGTTTNFYYSDNWQVLEEQVSSAAQAQYVWGIRYIDDLVLRDDNDAGTLDRRMYALQDANWNVTAITDSLGTVVQRFEYDAYGKPINLAPNFTTPYTGTNYQWEYKFTGRRIDLETELYQYRNRYYHSELGRFISQDPIGYEDGINLYQYVLNNPIIYRDPSGLLTVVLFEPSKAEDIVVNKDKSTSTELAVAKKQAEDLNKDLDELIKSANDPNKTTSFSINGKDISRKEFIDELWNRKMFIQIPLNPGAKKEALASEIRKAFVYAGPKGAVIFETHSITKSDPLKFHFGENKSTIDTKKLGELLTSNSRKIHSGKLVLGMCFVTEVTTA